MSDDLKLPDALAEAYAAALHALARSDGEIGAEESAHLDRLLAHRTTQTFDAELLFFSPKTPEQLGATIRADARGKDVARALIRDAVALSVADGDLNGKEATAILRFARALKLDQADVRAETALLDEWLHQLG